MSPDRLNGFLDFMWLPDWALAVAAFTPAAVFVGALAYLLDRRRQDRQQALKDIAEGQGRFHGGVL